MSDLGWLGLVLSFLLLHLLGSFEPSDSVVLDLGGIAKPSGTWPTSYPQEVLLHSPGIEPGHRFA